MSMFQRIFGRGAANEVQRSEPTMTASAAAETDSLNPASWILGQMGGGQSRVSTLPRVTPDIALRHATVLACGSIIAGDLAKIPLQVMQKDRKTGRMVRVNEHALDYLLNVESTFGVPAILTRFNAIFAFVIRGNGYSYAPRDGSGQPLLIEYVNNDNCNVLRDGRARFYEFEDGAGVHRRVPARSMVHLRYMAADNWTGRSPISVAAESVGIALAGQESAARTVSGTSVRGYVKLEDTFKDQESKDRGITSIREMLANPAIKGWPILGENDAIETLDMSAADIELLSSRKFDREQLAAIYRVPPSKLQMLEFGVKANGQQQAIDYKSDCLTHWGNMAQDFMEVTLLTRAERQKGLHLVHNYDALMEATTKDRFEAYSKAIGGPWMPASWAQDAEGIERTPGSDVLYPPSNMTRDAVPADQKENDE